MSGKKFPPIDFWLTALLPLASLALGFFIGGKIFG
ncbi:hypothetical protein ZZ1p0113 [Acinetobacter phage ZZ1]|uniref:Uncharacterized protein n=1 Tax=Acinetobacter phage ZZ1 TaxID=1049283 RepID=W0AYS6_9CAUD|nr:hypothetical protein ZZ1p0113 [Acinetobacter phage ZZ1]AHE63453.1 hypothetical protein ZZ1p0113 [Acinetobacter phage ZZ1]